MDNRLRETTNLCVLMNSKRVVMAKLGHVEQCTFAV